MSRPSREALLAGPVLPMLLRLGLPTIAVLVAQIMVSVIETYWASRLGTDALAGVALVSPILVLMTTMSNGGIGGGVSSAIARALGRGRRDEADSLVWHALVLAAGFGLVFTFAAVIGGPALYAALGGEGDALAAALLYSNWVFAGAAPLWAVNLMSAALRGAGESRLPARVSLAGAALLVALSPALIFGLGPLPAMGLAGAGLAVNVYYLAAFGVLWRHLRRGSGALSLRPASLSAARFRAILGVGIVSALGTLMASVTIVLVTGAVGLAGAASLAGYGVASRIDVFLIPLLFGLGTAVVTMVGVATGAGDGARAQQVAWTAAALAVAVTETIGLAAAILPETWMALFTDEPAVLAAGAAYLRAAAPFYGALGLALILYFACQGMGRMLWPFLGGAARLTITAGAAWMLARTGFGMTGIGFAVAAGTVMSALVTAVGFARARPRAPALKPA